jgi:hypothetical protein
MDSTVIAILLASVAVFYKAPFVISLVSVAKILQRRWRHIVFVILALALITAQTHSRPFSNQTASSSDGIPPATCRKS